MLTIKDSQGKKILALEIRNKLFSNKVNIVFQNLKEIINLKENDKLVVGEKKISIVKNSKIFCKYKSSILVDNQKIGEINEEQIFPYKKYFITFIKNESINYYSIILFAITSVYFADGI
ncbi:hypothetical protein [Chryseobacterium indologenes]|uniref:Uncharacterized protein n=1 Tax=Chryseobacterium indologenes TaxID=253 RepID=A0A0N0ZS19_CHRID|nr:hypothetical protein [Chryseobacterium indologenes]KPE48966.1 hypothetical protein AOB46_22560 [Chryseobacterium indologenes]